jgi:predicted RNase H-like nuclease
MSCRMRKVDLANANDDELDAWTTWYLARCWLDRCGVILLGDARTGSFLLPDEPGLQKKFERFLRL